MKKYELIRERFTPCSGDRHPQTTMEELTLQDPAAYVQDLFHLEKHLRIDQRQAGASLVVDVYTGSIHQRLNADGRKVLCVHQFQQRRQDVLPDIGVLFLIVHVLHGMIQTPFFVSFWLRRLTQYCIDDTLVPSKSQEERSSQ